MDFNLELELRHILEKSLPDAALTQSIPKRKSKQILLKTILNLCEKFTSTIEIQRVGRTRSYLVKNKDALSQDTYQQYMVYGAQLIFLIRHRLMDEPIDYYFTGDNANALIPEHEVLQELTMVSKDAVGLTYALEKKLIEAQKKRQMDSSALKQWQRIQQLSETSKIWDHSADWFMNKRHAMYQKNNIDQNVYAMWSGGESRTITTYYNYEGDMILFNQGWLWEWFLDKYYNNDNFEIKNSLKPLFEGNTRMDNIRATKQGDLKINGRWVQAKNRNEQIIAVNAILEIIYNLTAVLKLYDQQLSDGSVSKRTETRLKTLLNRYFIPKEIEGGKEEVRKKVEEILDMLRQKT